MKGFFFILWRTYLRRWIVSLPAFSFGEIRPVSTFISTCLFVHRQLTFKNCRLGFKCLYSVGSWDWKLISVCEHMAKRQKWQLIGQDENKWGEQLCWVVSAASNKFYSWGYVSCSSQIRNIVSFKIKNQWAGSPLTIIVLKTFSLLTDGLTR